MPGHVRKFARSFPLCAILGVAALLAFALPVEAAAGAKLGVTAARWTAEKAELRVEGTSTVVDGVVIVRDAKSRKVVGSAAVRRDGKWILKVREPNFLPKRMLVECEGAKSECEVETVAAGTQEAAPPTATR